MRRDRSVRILAEGITASNDTWLTGLNNNTLVIGPSGAGKTRGYVIPNILASEGSIVVTDTKGELYEQLAVFRIFCKRANCDAQMIPGA